MPKPARAHPAALNSRAAATMISPGDRMLTSSSWSGSKRALIIVGAGNGRPKVHCAQTTALSCVHTLRLRHRRRGVVADHQDRLGWRLRPLENTAEEGLVTLLGVWRLGPGRGPQKHRSEAPPAPVQAVEHDSDRWTPAGQFPCLEPHDLLQVRRGLGTGGFTVAWLVRSVVAAHLLRHSEKEAPL